MSPFSRFTKSAFPLLVGVTAAAAFGAQAPHQHAAAPSGYARSEAYFQAPPVSLIDSHGEPRRLSSLLDYRGPVILQFIFTTCTTVCPLMSAAISGLQEEL